MVLPWLKGPIMPNRITLTLDDETQALVEQVRRLSNDALHVKRRDSDQIIAAALKLGLRRDLSTLRRVASLTQRWS